MPYFAGTTCTASACTLPSAFLALRVRVWSPAVKSYVPTTWKPPAGSVFWFAVSVTACLAFGFRLMVALLARF